MDVEIKRLDTTICAETYDAVEKLAKRQNSQFCNVVDALLRQAVAETYRRWPNLKDKAAKGEE